MEARAWRAELFFSTKDWGKRTGLGLSMVRGCAKQADDRVEIDSTMGQGIRIRIALPFLDSGAG